MEMNDTCFGKAAIKKMGQLPDGFQIFEAGWMEKLAKDFNTMFVKGAVFREAKSGPRKGQKVVMVPGTTRTVYVTRSEMQEFSL